MPVGRRHRWEIFFEGLKAGLLTFGGAYTVVPFLHGSAVEGHHWLTDDQFVEGLAISGTPALE